MFKKVKPQEVETLFDKPIKQSGGAPVLPCDNNTWNNFSENEQAQLLRAYDEYNIWDPYHNAGGDAFSCTPNDWGEVGDIECACKNDPISWNCLEQNNMIQLPNGWCYNRENLKNLQAQPNQRKNHRMETYMCLS